MQDHRYDIIIPVYNAFEELVECIDSLIKNTEYPYRVIIIEDCSTDKRIRPYLETLNKMDHFHIILNKKNEGFVKSVNKGMSFSDSDVVLLNSDTILTKNWLSKMNYCAYSSNNIATVTPLTNNGTICSVPNFGIDNEIPNGYDIQSFAELIEMISMRKYPTIPTAVGFCMLIKRKVINEIGLFDEITYLKGYGEENDFCCRAMEHGYIHVIDDATFIYHKGSMSFKAEKAALISQNAAALARKFPYYFSRVEQFIHNNPLASILENINLRMKTFANNKKKILYVVHNTVDEDWIQKRGGTEFHIFDLIKGLENDQTSYVLTTNGTRMLLKEFQKDKVNEYNFYLTYPIENHTFFHDDYRDNFEKILCTFKIDIVHVHHFQRHTFDIPYICHKLKVPSILTVHDFHLICPSVLLIDTEGQYCLDIKTEQKCNDCLYRKMGYGTNFRKKWVEVISQILPLFDQIIFPSLSAKSNFQKEYQLDEHKIKVIEHGISTSGQNDYRNISSENKTKNVAFIGTFAQHKGSSIIIDILNHSKSDMLLNWYLLGEIHDPVLEDLKQDNVYKLGSYKRESIVSILKELKVDLVCLVSLCPETFSYTLSEAWAANIPVLANNRGAFSTRIIDNVNGWKINSEKGSDYVNKIKQIFNDINNYLNVQENISKQKVVTTDVMVKYYKESVYSLVKQNSDYNGNVFSNKQLYESLLVFNSSNIHLEEEIRRKDAELQIIYNTVGWRLLNYLRKNKIIQKYGRKVLLKLIKLKTTRQV